ncbi:BREX-2 system phosphatase PglZ, partial [Saccharomonospora iraqiensis]|uniref:BREX-2 system phosphatase PglZ n=1 Tax=Saccharomonospora iraqiensis TaxID=52698 RepID=UPI000557E014
MSAPPEVDRRIVESLVEEYLPAARGRRLLLVHGKYVGTAEPFTVRTADDRHRVHVVDRHSVLGILEAWQEHQHTHPDDGDLLVVTTGVDDEQLGWDVRAYAIHRSVRPVDRASVVAQRFGAVDVDPRLHEEKWLVEALLDAEPPEGWPRDGSVLTRDAAIRALIGVRLGRSALGDGALDIGALLDFSLDRVATARFAELPHAERDGIIRWLADTVGDAAALLLRLVADGRAADAVPLGIVGGAAPGP